MAFSGGARRLCAKLSPVARGCYGRHYSTPACNGGYFSRCRESLGTSFSSSDANSQLGMGIFLRRFSVAASDQTNLIKQLRERTSAPIKDVKAALVDSNWDIGTELSNFLYFEHCLVLLLALLNVLAVIFMRV